MGMPEAIEADRAARASEHGWIVDRFILPGVEARRAAARRAAAERRARRGRGGPRGGARRAPRRAAVELVEARIDPAWIPDTPAARGRQARRTACGRSGSSAPGRGLSGAVAAVREARAGAKIRCGGATGAAGRGRGRVRGGVPRRRRPVQGDGRPAPRDPRRRRARLPHNLLAAAVFAHIEGLSAAELEPLLAEEDPTAFAADADGLRVHGREAGEEAIAEARAELFVGLRLVLGQRAGRGPDGARDPLRSASSASTTPSARSSAASIDASSTVVSSGWCARGGEAVLVERGDADRGQTGRGLPRPADTPAERARAPLVRRGEDLASGRAFHAGVRTRTARARPASRRSAAGPR